LAFSGIRKPVNKKGRRLLRRTWRTIAAVGPDGQGRAFAGLLIVSPMIVGVPTRA
jgi:hypothetical protein